MSYAFLWRSIQGNSIISWVIFSHGLCAAVVFSFIGHNNNHRDCRHRRLPRIRCQPILSYAFREAMRIPDPSGLIRLSISQPVIHSIVYLNQSAKPIEHETAKHGIRWTEYWGQEERRKKQLEALGECTPPPRHVLSVPSSDESVWAADLCTLTTFRISQ